MEEEIKINGWKDTKRKIERRIDRQKDRNIWKHNYNYKSFFVNTIDYKSYIKHKLQLWRQRKEIAKKKKNQFLKDDRNGKRQKEK